MLLFIVSQSIISVIYVLTKLGSKLIIFTEFLIIYFTLKYVYNPNIVIQKADKVNTFFILDKELYFEKLVRRDHLDSNSNMLRLINTATKMFFQD